MNIDGGLLDSGEDSQSSLFSAYSIPTADSESQTDDRPSTSSSRSQKGNNEPRYFKEMPSRKGGPFVTENMVHLLQRRELGRGRRKVSELKAGYVSDRNFYPCVPLNRFAIMDALSFNGHPIAWTPDGKRLIVFSLQMRAVLIYRYLGVDRAMGRKPEELNKALFSLEHDVQIVSRLESQTTLKMDIALVTEDNQQLIVVTTSQVPDTAMPLHAIHAHNQSLGIVNQGLENYTFYSIHLETGVLCGSVQFPSDRISLTSGLGIFKRTLVILSTQHQVIHVLSISPHNGQIYRIKEIGRTINEDDQLFIGNETPNEIIETRWMTGFKQRLNTFMFLRAKSQGLEEIGKFLSGWDARDKLRIYRMQMIDEARILLRLIPKTVLSHTDYLRQASFYVIFDWKTSQILDVFEDITTDSRFLALFEECLDNLAHPSMTYNTQAPLTIHHNFYAHAQYMEALELHRKTVSNGGTANYEHLRRMLTVLPFYYIAQCSVATPYLDPYLFVYDDQFFKTILSGRSGIRHENLDGTPLPETKVKFRSRRTGEHLFSFRYPIRVTTRPGASQQVTILFHPTDPLVLSVDRINPHSPFVLTFPQSSQIQFKSQRFGGSSIDFGNPVQNLPAQIRVPPPPIVGEEANIL